MLMLTNYMTTRAQQNVPLWFPVARQAIIVVYPRAPITLTDFSSLVAIEAIPVMTFFL